MSNQETRPGQDVSQELAPYTAWPAKLMDTYTVKGEVKRRFDVTTPTGVWGITTDSPEEARVKAHEFNELLESSRKLSNQTPESNWPRPVVDLRPEGSLSPDSFHMESIEEYGMFDGLRQIILGKIYKVSVFRAFTSRQKEITRVEGVYETIVQARFLNRGEAFKVGQRTLARLLEKEKEKQQNKVGVDNTQK